jgi:hypothetical protein
MAFQGGKGPIVQKNCWGQYIYDPNVFLEDQVTEYREPYLCNSGWHFFEDISLFHFWNNFQIDWLPDQMEVWEIVPLPGATILESNNLHEFKKYCASQIQFLRKLSEDEMDEIMRRFE